MAPSKIHLLMMHGGSVRRAVRFHLGKGDLYIIPDLPAKTARCGEGELKEGEDRANPPLPKEGEEGRGLHLSLHRDGRVHVKSATNYMAGPLQSLPLGELRGQHIASIVIPAFESLPRLERDINRDRGKEEDYVFPVPDGCESARITVHVSKEAGVLTRSGGFTSLTFTGEDNSELHLGLRMIGKKERLGPDPSGLILIGGWRPDEYQGEDPRRAQRFLFVKVDLPMEGASGS